MAPDTKKVASDAFKGNDNLTIKHLEKLSAPDLKTALDKIIGGWRGKVTAIVSCELANDTRMLANMNMNLMGEIFDRQTKSFKTDRFWETGTPLTLNLHSLDSNKFTFKGSMVSELLDWSEIDHSFTGENSSEQLAEGDVQQTGVPGFCLRAYLTPTCATHLKLNLALYPLPKAKLLEEFAVGNDAAFPGFSCFYGDIQLHPVSSKVLPFTNWGSPAAFILLCASPLAGENTPIPTTAVFRAALSALMRTAVKPEMKANLLTLTARWKEIRERGEAALIHKMPELVWPEPANNTVTNPQGMSLVHPVEFFVLFGVLP